MMCTFYVDPKEGSVAVFYIHILDRKREGTMISTIAVQVNLQYLITTDQERPNERTIY